MSDKKKAGLDECWDAYLIACKCIADRNSFRRCALYAVFTVLVLSIIFQSVGLFTSNWGYNTTCSEIGLIKTNCGNSTVTGVNALNKHILGLQGFSVALSLASLLWYGILCWQSDRKDDSIFTFCFPCFIPLLAFVSGFLNFIGSMIVRGMLPEMGYSFYMCLTASLLLMLTSLLFMISYLVHKYRATEQTKQRKQMEQTKQTTNTSYIVSSDQD